MRGSRHISRLVALLVFGTLSVSFLHSELGVWDFDNDNHGHHDFCELVKSATAMQKVAKSELVNPVPLKDMMPARAIEFENSHSTVLHNPLALLGQAFGVTDQSLHINHCALLI